MKPHCNRNRLVDPAIPIVYNPGMGQRGRPRSFNRQDALRAALEVFWTKGYANTSMAELTQAMGIHPPSLYAAFGSKEELFRAVVDLYVETAGRGIWDHVATAPTARAAIEHVLRSSAEAFTRPPTSRGCLVVQSALPTTTDTAVSDELKARRNANIDLLKQRFERAVAEGELPLHVDCAALAAYFGAVQHGMSIQAHDGASRETLLAVADCAMAVWDQMVQ